MKFLNKKYLFQYTFLLIFLFSLFYNLSYDIKPLFYALCFILIILLSVFLRIFIKKILNEEDLKKLKDDKKSCIELGICFTFLSLYPVLHFYVNNYVSLDIHYLIIGIFTILFGISIFTLIYLIILRNFYISFYLSSIIGVMLYFINAKNTAFLSIFLIIALFICILYFLYKKGTKQPFKNIIITVATVLAIFVCLDFILVLLKTEGGVRNDFKNAIHSMPKNEFQDNKKIDNKTQRDIYILMLDMYPGVEGLKEFSGFDNSNFADELRKRGFYVFNDIYSNYSKTAMSISSMLNMNYIEDTGYKNHWDAINNAYIFKLARAYGLETIYFNHSTYFRLVKPVNTKLIHTLSAGVYYENELIKTYNDSLIYMACHSFIWDKIKIGKEADLKPFQVLKQDVVSDKSRKFVFAHIMMPHPPYLYDEYGNKRTDFSEMRDKQENSKVIINKENLISYLKYANKEVLNFIDYAIEHSDKPPVILISGDHGIRANEYENWGKHIDETLSDKFSMYLTFDTFAAYYNPYDNKEEIKKAKSIVNLYRLFSNEMFNTKYDIIPDKHTILFCTMDCTYNFKNLDKSKTYSNKELIKLF